jgi:hypothetical protein
MPKYPFKTVELEMSDFNEEIKEKILKSIDNAFVKWRYRHE